MKRSENRKKRRPARHLGIKVLIFAAAAFLVALAVCAADQAMLVAQNPPLDISLQNIEIEEIYFNPSLKGSIAADRQTGVLYWISQDGAATLLVREDGKPRLWNR